MSKTPRTEEQILHHDNGNGHPSDFVFASFARQLETELAEARAETISLAVEIGQALILRSIKFTEGESVSPRNHAIWRAMRKTISERDEARAEIERLDHQRRAGWTEIKRKNKLIEQMREAAETYRELCNCYRLCKKPTEKLFKRLEIAKAALAAKRGG